MLEQGAARKDLSCGQDDQVSQKWGDGESKSTSTLDI
jgi:hypothetical protein